MFDSAAEPQAVETAIQPAEPVSLDLNFLPERYRGRRLRFSALRPWLLLISFALLTVPVADLLQRHSATLDTVQLQFDAVSAALDGYEPLADERAALEARIDAAEAERVEIEAAYEQIDIQPLRWSELIPRLMSAAPSGVHFSSIEQSGAEITIEGIAEAYSLPSQYVDNLAALDELDSVVVQMVTKLEPEDLSEELPEDTADESGGEGDPAAGEPAEDQLVLYQFEISAVLPLPVQAPAEDGFSE